jgi:Co/Zn/Cd efflux system component
MLQYTRLLRRNAVFSSVLLNNVQNYSTQFVRNQRKNANRPSYKLLNDDKYRSFSVGSHSTEDSKRLVKIALLGNMVITIAKAVCWLSTGSSAMLSETVHSLVDSGNQALLLVGLRGADAAPDKAHPCMFYS